MSELNIKQKCFTSINFQPCLKDKKYNDQLKKEQKLNEEAHKTELLLRKNMVDESKMEKYRTTVLRKSTQSESFKQKITDDMEEQKRIRANQCCDDHSKQAQVANNLKKLIHKHKSSQFEKTINHIGM